MTTQALPEWIETPLTAVFRDLLPGRDAHADVTWTPEGEDKGTLSLPQTEDRCSVERDDVAPAALTVQVATWVQESVVPQLAPEAGIVPVCPGHDHPQRARTLYAVAWWSCPDAGTPLDVIGG